MTSEQCKLLNDSAKSDLRTMLGFSGNESSSDASYDDESSDKDNRGSGTNDSKDSESNSDYGANNSDVSGQCHEEKSGGVFDSHPGTAVEAYGSSSSEDTGPPPLEHIRMRSLL